MKALWHVLMQKVRLGELTLGAALGLFYALIAGSNMVIEQAVASVPAEVTTAITDAGTDGRTVAIAFLVAIITIIAVKLMRRGA